MMFSEIKDIDGHDVDDDSFFNRCAELLTVSAVS